MINWDRLNEILEYDENTGVFTYRVSRGNRVAGSIAGSINHEGYRRIVIEGLQYMEHRLAWFYTYKKWPKEIIDHIDRNKTNNRIINLREATNSENLRNAKLSSVNAVGLKGVTFYKRTGKYQAKIYIEGKRKHLGYFNTPEEAHKKYVEQMGIHYGDFGSTGK